ncbi:sensor histidine kinase [Microbispora sp. NEAU-D428]|uniref:sensor histidine kinase n=1 Tax=Microbispora sitophila TaxID=2771537 RepID=UPI0018685865|nr:sensor histidine kinase [Microbispora sitophila]MBE3014702.1 sensor histidine kinase [Microbispora sitophila]
MGKAGKAKTADVPEAVGAAPAGEGRLPAAAAVAAVAALLAVAAGTVLLDVLARGTRVPAGAELDPGWTSALAGLAQAVPGVLLLRRLPRHPVAWVLTGSGVMWLLNGAAAAWATYAVYVEPGLPGASAAYWFYLRLGAALLLQLPLLILLFPDGRLPAAPLWRRLSIASLALTAALPALRLVAPVSVLSRHGGVPLPPELARLALDPVALPLPYAVWEPLLTAASSAVVVSLVVPFAVTVHRYRAAASGGPGDADRRAQIRWLTWAALADMLVLLLPLVLPPDVPAFLLTVAVALTSFAVVVAIAKHRLYDVDRLLPATFGYGMAAVLVIVVDAAVFTAAAGAVDERQAALAAIAVVTLVYLPARTWLVRTVRRLLRGPREDPYATVSTLAERLELAAGPDEQLVALARTLAEAFRLSYVRVEIERPDGKRSAVEHGVARGPSVSLPVAYRGEQVGRLVLCRADLTERDQRLLGDLVRQAAAAARATEMSAGLQRIRATMVVAREEERRRLRRDLHDGLGPSLGAVALRIETARNLSRTAPEQADAILARTAEEVSAVVAEVRQIVHDLRPPALDELGLRGAVEQQAGRFRGGLTVVLSGVLTGDDEPLPALPAAVEVAAYRIVSEALANVARHAHAARCEIGLAVRDGMLHVVVRDDGVGIDEDVTAGVGMLSLRERAAELGGDCVVTCPEGGGTLVHARLPLAETREFTGV